MKINLTGRKMKMRLVILKITGRKMKMRLVARLYYNYATIEKAVTTENL